MDGGRGGEKNTLVVLSHPVCVSVSHQKTEEANTEAEALSAVSCRSTTSGLRAELSSFPCIISFSLHATHITNALLFLQQLYEGGRFSFFFIVVLSSNIVTSHKIVKATKRYDPQ